MPGALPGGGGDRGDAGESGEARAGAEPLGVVARGDEERRRGDGTDAAQRQQRRIDGSSDIRWGSWGESAGGEEHAEPVVVAVAEAAGEAAVQLDDPVHGLSAAVR